MLHINGYGDMGATNVLANLGLCDINRPVSEARIRQYAEACAPGSGTSRPTRSW